MKKCILLTFLLVVSGGLFSQNRLSVNHLTVVRSGDVVEVSFQGICASKSPNINDTYTFTPTIVNGANRQSLRPIVMGSKRAEILSQRKGLHIQPFYHKGDTVRYHYATPYAAWMADAVLVMEGIVEGCCAHEMVCAHLLASHILPKPVELPAAVPPLLPVAPPTLAATPSAGKRMADRYAFVAPQSALMGIDGKPVMDFTLPLQMGKATDEPTQQAIEEYLAQNNDDALNIYFKLSGTVIDPQLKANTESMKQLLEAIHSINSSPDSRITHIVIAGYASPEGALVQNEKLAWGRALALKKFITTHTKVATERIHLYNGGENWMGLRQLIRQGTMPHRDEVMHIIDQVSVRKGRETRLMELYQGTPYRYMMRHYFPQLRHAACIKIYYEETTSKTNRNIDF